MYNVYFGKTCPFCKGTFDSDDEIVVCSDCDMPHHKDCWIENQGCTTFGCLGSIKGVDGSATSVTAKEISYDDSPGTNDGVCYCTKCGTQNSRNNSFCINCGNHLTVSAATAVQPSDVRNNSNTITASPQYTPQNQQNTQNNTYYQQADYQNYGANGYSQGTAIDEFRGFVGIGFEYYMTQFNKMKQRNTKCTWNWPAFLVAVSVISV